MRRLLTSSILAKPMRHPGIARKRSDGLLYRMERSLRPPEKDAREKKYAYANGNTKCGVGA